MAKPPPDIDPPGKGGAPTFENRNDVPMVYFDIAPAYGVMSGIVQVELGRARPGPASRRLRRCQIRFLRQASLQRDRRNSSQKRA